VSGPQTAPRAHALIETTADACLLTGLLRAVERSSAYRTPETWTKPVIVRWDTAWALDPVPEDAERLRAQRSAAAALQRAGAGTVTYDKPPHDDRPRTIRCGPREFSVLLGLARAQGIIPLADVLDEVRAAWGAMRATPSEVLPEWWRDYEARLSTALEQPAPTGIGIGVDRIADDWVDWIDSVRAARGIASGVSGFERVVSERLLGHSKRLATLRRTVAAHLRAADPQWAGRPEEPPAAVLLLYGVRRMPTMLDIAGPVRVEADGSRLDISRIEGLVRCPGAWAAAIAAAASTSEIRVVTTIENETSAWAYVEEMGGPAGLGARRELVLYTSGFAAGVGVAVLGALAREIPRAEFRHWGDADEHGLRIWLDLVGRSHAPIRWWRTTSEWVRRATTRGAGKALTEAERRSLSRFRQALLQATVRDPTLDPGRVAVACADSLLHDSVKVEQEAFEPSLDTDLD
jgi:hypothetical protein